MEDASADTDGWASPSTDPDDSTDVQDSKGAPEEDLREATDGASAADDTESAEKTAEGQGEDSNPEERDEPHNRDTLPEEAPGCPGEPSGDPTEETTAGEVNECSCNAEPGKQDTGDGECEEQLGTEEKNVTEKEEDEMRLVVGAKGVEEDVTAEDEAGEKNTVGEEEGTTPETACAPPSPEPQEKEKSEVEALQEKPLVASEIAPEKCPSDPAAAEGGSAAAVTETDGDVHESAGSVEPSTVSEGPVATEKPAAPEKKKPVEKKRDIGRSRTVPKSHGAQSRKAIMEKFGGPATGASPGIKVQRSTSFGASGVKNMLLEWCKAKTRDYEHVDIQNFSSSWSSGMAFCALVHKFFPDEFDFATLDPKNRRQNFELAFTTAEKCADCAQLLEVDDMVRMRVPDSKCVYTYVQELYRSLVQMGLVKTKKQQKADCMPLVEVEDMMVMGPRPDPMCVFTYVQSLHNHLLRVEKHRNEGLLAK